MKKQYKVVPVTIYTVVADGCWPTIPTSPDGGNDFPYSIWDPDPAKLTAKSKRLAEQVAENWNNSSDED